MQFVSPSNFNKFAQMQGGLALWSPIQEPSTLKAFYLPGIGQTNASGNCSAWADQSGNGNNLAQGSAGARPLINADGSLTFDGTADWMRVAFTLNQPSVVTLLVNQLTETGAANRIMDGTTINTGALFSAFPGTGQIQAFAGSFGPIRTISNATLQVWQVVFNGANSTLQINNGTAATADAGAANMGGITFGADGAASPTTFTNIKLYGASVRNATDTTINANDRLFWMRMAGLA